ncbi:MAG TPA: hypothetical protein VFB14_05170 [Bryobacteraceae bacterium]|jgi:hypothetical protein|nr:hypothetical protein [Bryobacteraceae bacterium]
MIQSESIRKQTLLHLTRLISDYGEIARLSKLGPAARAIRLRWNRTMKAVRSGTYRVDAMQLSRRIVNELLGFN